MRTALLLVLMVLLALGAGWYMGAKRSSEEIRALATWPPVEEVPAPPSDKVPRTVSEAPGHTSGPMVAANEAEDEDWIEMPERAIPAPPLMEALGSSILEGELAHTQQVVESGGTLVTEPYEVKPGVFNYSAVTPKLSILEDGAPGVEVNVQRYQFDVSGGYYQDLNQTLSMVPGSDSALSFQEGNQGFASVFRVELVPGSGQIRVTATDFRAGVGSQTPPAAPADEP